MIKHRDENRISVQFEKEARLIQRVNEFDGARSSAQKNIWHLPDTFENREHCNIIQYEKYATNRKSIWLFVKNYLYIWNKIKAERRPTYLSKFGVIGLILSDL